MKTVVFLIVTLTFALVGCDHEGGMQPNLERARADIRSHDYVSKTAGLSEAVFSADTIDVRVSAPKFWYVGDEVRISALVWNSRTSKPIPNTEVWIKIGPCDGPVTTLLSGNTDNNGVVEKTLKVEGDKLTPGSYRVYATACWDNLNKSSEYFYFKIKKKLVKGKKGPAAKAPKEPLKEKK